MKEKKDLIKLPPVNLRAKGVKLPASGTLLAKSFDGKRLPDQLRLVFETIDAKGKEGMPLKAFDGYVRFEPVPRSVI
jgi:hypothetical protein